MNSTESTSRSWLVVLTATAFFFYSFIQMTLFSTQEMKEYFMTTLSIPDANQFGVFAGMFLNACVIFLIPFGILLDKLSVKKLILGMLALATLSTIALAFTSNLTLAMILRFITGAAHCVAFMAPLRLAPRWFPSKRLAFAVGILITFAIAGGLISQTPMYWAITAFGGKTTMLANGILGLVIFVLIAFIVKDYPDGYTAEKSTESELPLIKSLALALRNLQNWLAGLYIGLLNLSVLLLGAIWGTNYLVFKNPELGSEIITSVIGMIFIGTMIGTPLWGMLSDKFQNRKKTMLAGAIISFLIMVVIIIIQQPGSAMLYMLFLLLGFTTAAQTLGYPVIAESNDEKIIGTANGFSAVLIMGMAAIAQPLFGSLVNMFGGETFESYTKAIYLMLISFGIAFICAVLLKESYKR
jgi:MFS family permease